MEVRPVKPLSMLNALQLYFLVQDHIPIEFEINYDFLQFIGKISQSMTVYEYVDTVSLMTGIPTSEFHDEDKEQVLVYFIVGMQINRIYELIQFCRAMGF